LPDTRSKLYKRAVDVLFCDWDHQRVLHSRIEDSTYGDLDIESKSQILSEISYRMFLQDTNFTQASEAKITQWISDVRGLRKNCSTQILKGIAADHGFLTGCAAGTWKFLHLSFQEYFAGQWLLQNPDRDWRDFLKFVSISSFKEILEISFESSDNKVSFLNRAKNEVDTFLNNNSPLQELLQRICIKSKKIGSQLSDFQCVGSSLLQIRAFYFAIEMNDIQALHYGFPSKTENPHFKVNNFFLADGLPEVLQVDYQSWLILYNAYCIGSEQRYLDSNSYVHILRQFDNEYNVLMGLALSEEYRMALQCIKEKLPNESGYYFKDEQTWEIFVGWAVREGKKWATQLQAVIIEHCGIRYSYTEKDFSLLNRYYEMNKLLSIFLEQYRSADQASEYGQIEDNLLLPIAELKRRLPDQYGS
jgi:hypothetical protein